jgi:hypothetical protein
MTVRLGNLVESGEICNTRWYSVHGWIQLRGSEHPILLQLTGNCDPDLAGWRIRFQARDHSAIVEADPTPASAFNPADLAGEQIGPTGTMTAKRRVQVAQCTAAELARRCRLGEPPPTTWSSSLYLEWFSQDGHIVVELPDPVIEFVEYTRLEDPRQSDRPWVETASFADPHREEIDAGFLPPDDKDDDFSDDPADPLSDLDDAALGEPGEEIGTEPDWWNEEDKPQFIREMELMDELIERGDGEIIGSLFDGPVRFPRPEQLDDEAVEKSLKLLLSQMAMFNISLDVCQHFSPREAYRLLIERICAEEQAYPELRHTQWIQHFTTAEFCPQCEADWERDCQEFERRRRPPADEPWQDDDSSDDDLTSFH